MSAQPYANGGRLLRQLVTPNWMEYCVDVQAPATTFHEPTRVLGGFLRDVMPAANSETANFRVFGPDETDSNRLSQVLEVTGKAWAAEILQEEWDSKLSRDGRVMEILSEHVSGLAGGLSALTGRHGLFSCYRRSSTSSTRCSTSTRSGSTQPVTSAGEYPSHR